MNITPPWVWNHRGAKKGDRPCGPPSRSQDSRHRLPGRKLLRRPAEFALQQAVKPAHDLLRLLPHIVGEPAHHHAGNGVHVEISEEIQLPLRQGQVPCTLRQSGGGDGTGQAEKVAVQVVPSAGAVYVIDGQMVVLHIAEGGPQGVLPAIRPPQRL